MKVILQIFYSVFSGALLAAAIPNEIFLFGCPIITVFALIPYYQAIKKAENYKEAFVLGFIQALVTHLISSFWLAYFKDFAIFTLGASAFGTACIGGFFALFMYLPFSSSTAQNQLNEKTLTLKWTNSVPFRVIYFASVYTMYEWAKSSGFLGYPWGTVSSAMFRWPILTQLAAITGEYGITYIICLFNGFLAELLSYYWDSDKCKKSYSQYFYFRQSFLFLYFLMIQVLLYGVFQYGITRKPIKEVTTVLVQQNSDPWKQKTDKENITVSENLTKERIEELRQEGKKPDLVVWSEGVLKYSFPAGKNVYWNVPEENPLLQYISSTYTPFIIGGSYIKDRELKKYFNASILFDGNGHYRGIYGKNHLVPFAEALPFMEVPAIHNFVKKVVGISAGWTPGDQYVFFEIPCKTTKNYKLPAVKTISLNKSFEEQTREEELPPTVKIATPICFDDSFTDIMRPLFLNGAELYVNITDDSWSLKKSSEIQHFCIASYKAIEYRTTLVRSANAGYSVVLDPSGKILKDMPLFQEASITYDVPVYERIMTTYARFGNWLPYSLIVLFFAFAIYSYFTFVEFDYIPSERKIKKHSKKHKKNHSKHKK